nr:hypothetical protein [uncultured Brumimicrobium sp.]
MINIKCNYLILFLLLFTGLIASGCSKWSSGTTTVEFVIINPANGEPFPDVNVKIVEETSTNNKSRVMCEGKTDASGRITFEFTAKRTSKYWYTPNIDFDSFGVQGKDYSILVRPTVSSYAIIKNIYNEMRYEITYYAYLKLKIKNIVCEGLEDTLVYHAWTPDFKGGGGAYDYITTLSGCVDYETTGSVDNHPAGYAHVYMGWHKIEWEARKPSGITYGIDSVYIDKGGFGTLQVLY